MRKSNQSKYGLNETVTVDLRSNISLQAPCYSAYKKKWRPSNPERVDEIRIFNLGSFPSCSRYTLGSLKPENSCSVK